MKIRDVLFLVVGLLIFSTANATKTNYVKITEIKGFSSQAYIFVSGLIDSNSCGKSSLVRFYWTTLQADNLWPMILSAQMAGKDVAFDGQCVSGYLSVATVYIKS